MDEIILDKDVAKEVFTIILYSGKSIQNNIPENIIKRITDLAADSTLEVHLDKNKSLQEQNISKDALDVFSLLCYLYVANEEEKNIIYSTWLNNTEQ